MVKYIANPVYYINQPEKYAKGLQKMNKMRRAYEKFNAGQQKKTLRITLDEAVEVMIAKIDAAPKLRPILVSSESEPEIQ